MNNKNNLIKLRKKINKIDESILFLLSQRNTISKKIIKEKMKIDYPIQDNQREKKIYTKIIQKGKILNLKKKFLLKIFKKIIKNSVNIQKKILKNVKKKISFLGPKGSYSYLAFLKYAKKKIQNFIPLHAKNLKILLIMS
ncbi:chorismate mutase [Buchnera aphidicola]|uniref:chorismate mutase n=1 Tax=Buchnera aphidicola TaxID=9 RepID=UPI0034645999